MGCKVYKGSWRLKIADYGSGFKPKRFEIPNFSISYLLETFAKMKNANKLLTNILNSSLEGFYK